MLTPEQILNDLKTDRVKKVIFDGDFSAEIDDQYALAYALGLDKLEVLAANAVAHYEYPDRCDTLSTVTFSYSELLRTLYVLGVDRDNFKHFMGATERIAAHADYSPSDSAASRNIIETVKNSDEIVYIITTGPCTSAVSAYLMDPSIADNMCVVWLGGSAISDHTLKHSFHEWNLHSDYEASQILFNSDIPVIMMHADDNGSGGIIFDTEHHFNQFEGDSLGAEFFRKILPRVCATKDQLANGWSKVMCDLMGPATVAHPDWVEFKIIPAPVITDDYKYAIDSTRKKILYAEYPKAELIADDAVKAIKKLIYKGK